MVSSYSSEQLGWNTPPQTTQSSLPRHFRHWGGNNGTQPSSLTLCLAWSSRVLGKGSNIWQSFFIPAMTHECVCVRARASASLRPHLYRAAAVRMLLGIKPLPRTQYAPPPTTHPHLHLSTSSHLTLSIARFDFSVRQPKGDSLIRLQNKSIPGPPCIIMAAVQHHELRCAA